MKKQSNTLRQGAKPLIWAGGLLLIGSAISSIYSFVAAWDIASTTGVVDRIEKKLEWREDPDEPRERRKVAVKRPIVQYQVDSETYELEARNSIGIKVGEKLSVLYSLDNPSRGIVNTIWNRWGLALIFGGLGLFFFVFGVFVTPRKAITSKPSMFVWNEDAPALCFVLVGVALGGPLTLFLLSTGQPTYFPSIIFLLLSFSALILFPWAGFYLLYRQVRARWCFACRRPREKWNSYWYQCPDCGRGRWFDIPDGDKSRYQRK